MTDKSKITFIYIGVGLISAMILGMSYFLTTLRKDQRQEGPAAVETGKEEVTEIKTLERDIELVKQDGAAVKLSDLKDKVWIAAQFYAACPMCAERNNTRLLGLYEEFRKEEDFQVVCLSVDPESDELGHLMNMEQTLKVDGDSWWFVKTETQKLREFMRYEMLFGDIRERTVPAEIESKGRWSHDMGLQIYRGNVLVKKWHEGLPSEALYDEVRKALIQIKKDS